MACHALTLQQGIQSVSKPPHNHPSKLPNWLNIEAPSLVNPIPITVVI